MSELKLLKSKIDICPDSEAHLPCLLWRGGPALVGGRAGEDCIFQITSHCENAVNLWLQIFSEMTLEPPGAGAGPRASEHFTDSSLVVRTPDSGWGTRLISIVSLTHGIKEKIKCGIFSVIATFYQITTRSYFSSNPCQPNLFDLSMAKGFQTKIQVILVALKRNTVQ